MIGKLDPAGLDACVLDFDDCLYPGISKVSVAIRVSLSILLSPYQSADRQHLPRLALAAAILLVSRTSQHLGWRTTNADLVRSMWAPAAILLPYFQAAAGRLG